MVYGACHCLLQESDSVTEEGSKMTIRSPSTVMLLDHFIDELTKHMGWMKSLQNVHIKPSKHLKGAETDC